MVILKLSNLIIILIYYFFAKKDVIKVSNSKLILRLTGNNQYFNSFFYGSSRFFIGLTNAPDLIEILCSKIIPVQGLFEVSVNSKIITVASPCDVYGVTSENEIVCNQIIVFYTVELTDRNFKLNIECRLITNDNNTSSENSINYSVYKISK